MIEEKVITSIEELATEFVTSSGPWVYRGQRDSRWLLEPNISRIVSSSADSGTIHQIEKKLKHQFEASAAQYMDHTNLPNTEFGWLSLMQHYGAPSRLLDFTQSPFMALFFAMDGALHNDGLKSSIFAINYRELNKKLLEMTDQYSMDHGYTYEKFQLNQDAFFSEIVYKSPRDTLWIMDPLIKNQRIFSQGGSFLVKGNIVSPTLHLLNSVYAGVQMKNILIDHSLLVDAFDILAKCGISYHTVYPGLEGLGRDTNLMLLQNVRKALNKNSPNTQ